MGKTRLRNYPTERVVFTSENPRSRLGVTPHVSLLGAPLTLAGMQTTLFPFSQSSTELDITSTIQGVIAFEDLAAGKRAKQVYDYLTHRLTDFEFDHEVGNLARWNAQA